MKTNKPIDPEQLAHHIEKFRHWNDFGWKIHIEPNGSWKGERA
jgi:hypothetical protein